MSETQEVTPEFVQYIKERDAAVEEAEKAKAELRETQCKLYDSILLTEELEKKLKDLEANQKSTKTKKTTTATAGKKKLSDPASKGRRMSVKSAVSTGSTSRQTSFVSSARASEGGLYHPPVKDLEPVADSREYYWKLAEKFPTLPMHQILDAEKKFIKADTDNSGFIEIAELDKVLSDNVGLFTPDQLTTIFKEIDLDGSDTLDFHEVLFVINKLFSRRKTNLPQSVQQNYSKTCNVQ
ncbi:uncharacterized protein LOC132751066 [Ruditapes philippinarum]|uniref:uncharacterized protein LOC132751066 n=1 Tax=Ruditapes philippinarum TaxID=129788 RepID=UPI00295C1E79|nr:uncharacterized protein LOC132751066 [Ruditapes philippinarum]